MKKAYNVMSLFNGMSFGAMALETLNIKVDKYYSSEIDKYANQATKTLYPDVIQLGDVTKWGEWDIDWESVDLLIAGFPCQAWSMAGKQKGDDDPRGALVHDLISIWQSINKRRESAGKNPVKFMFENVKMKKEFLDYINNLFGVEPICINSALVSAQNRNRYYWTNIGKVEQPEDKGITWGDVREHGVDGFYYTEKGLQWLAINSQRKNKTLDVWGEDEKAQMLEASHQKNYSNQRFFGICDLPKGESSIASMRGRRINPWTGCRDDYNKDINIEQYIEFKYDKKSNCISTVQKDNVVVPFTLPGRIPLDLFFFRYITPKECARLQTVPEHHIDTLLSSGISNSQLYKMLGNGWTHDVIVHIFKGLITKGE